MHRCRRGGHVVSRGLQSHSTRHIWVRVEHYGACVFVSALGFVGGLRAALHAGKAAFAPKMGFLVARPRGK